MASSALPGAPPAVTSRLHGAAQSRERQNDKGEEKPDRAAGQARGEGESEGAERERVGMVAGSGAALKEGGNERDGIGTRQTRERGQGKSKKDRV